MKLARIGLAIILSLVLMALICPSVQASDESGSVDLIATGSLTISDVSASSIGYHGATISWKTNGDATSQVFYDTTGHDNAVDYAHQTDEDSNLVNEHSIRLTGLSSGATYHYRVRSAAVVDGSDFIAISGDYTFRTLSPPPEEEEWEPPPAPPPGTTDVRGMVSAAGVFTSSVTAISDDELCTLTIPEDTVGLTEELEPLDEIIILREDDPPEPPEDADIVLAYDLGPDGATFEPPITLTFSYDPADIPEGKDVLVVAYYDEIAEAWVYLEGEVDTENNTITVLISHFTTFAIIGRVPAPAPPAPAAFTVGSLAVRPAEVAPRGEVAISLLVANTGDVEGIYTVILNINGVKEAEKSVTVAAGSSETVTLFVTREEAGSYSISVDGLSGSFSVVVPVIIPPVPAEEEEEEVEVLIPEEEEEEVPPAKPINWWALGGIIGGIIVLVLVILFLVRRRRAA